MKSYMTRKKREIATMMPKMKAESRIYEVQLDPPRQRDTLRDLQENSKFVFFLIFIFILF